MARLNIRLELQGTSSKVEGKSTQRDLGLNQLHGARAGEHAPQGHVAQLQRRSGGRTECAAEATAPAGNLLSAPANGFDRTLVCSARGRRSDSRSCCLSR